MRKFLKYLIKLISKLITSFGFKPNMTSHLYRMRLYFLDTLIESLYQRKRNEKVRSQELFFSVPNYITDWRAQTASSKEPDTLDWIESFDDNSIFWDIGANIGLFSLYAAKTKKSNVLAFEPSVFNLEILARNITSNNLGDLITIIPLALSSKSLINDMNLSNTTWGGALSTFGENFGWDGNPIDSNISYKLLGSSIDELISNFNLPTPDYVKLDVDGLEHLILRGGINTLTKIKSILVEVNTSFLSQSNEVNEILKQSGLKLENSRLSEHEPDNISEDNLISTSTVYNQIWTR